MKKLGIGVIGCGGRLRDVFGHLTRATDQVEIVALCDPNPHSIEATKAAYNPAARVHEDYQALVRDPAVEWVMIGSWNCFHARHTIAAFEAGKNVFCEKPLALSVDDCLAIRDACPAAEGRDTDLQTARFLLTHRAPYEAALLPLSAGN